MKGIGAWLLAGMMMTLIAACGDTDEDDPPITPQPCTAGNTRCSGNSLSTCVAGTWNAGTDCGTQTCTVVSATEARCQGAGGSVCGDGNLTGFEWCESGDTADCADLGSTGMITCTDCFWDVSACTPTVDYCVAEAWNNDGLCDPCEDLGGSPDTADCALCGADGTCGEWYFASYGWTCLHVTGARDPDCGTCGNNTAETDSATWAEYCDGTDMTYAGTCADWGFTGGSITTCNTDCTPNLDDCEL